MSLSLLPDYHYHIFNRGNNCELLFQSESDYSHFLDLYAIYANPFFETYSWCLMNNHFHFCIRVKSDNEFGRFDKRNRWSKDTIVKWKLHDISEIPVEMQITPNPQRMFAFMFDAYAKYLNRKYAARGVVFERSCEMKLIDSDEYLIDLICYIHNNPVKHNICKLPEQYRWSSYTEILNDNSLFCNSEKIIQLYSSKDNFIYVHQSKFSNDFD